MKKFDFPLHRVMEFRRTQARLEEIKMENLYVALRAVDSREVALIEQRVQSEKALKAAKSVMGCDLESFNTYRVAMKEEQKRMDKTRAELRKKIDAQLAIVTAKRRDVKLLEHLKQRRFEAWEKDMLKEIDQQAEETFLAKWRTTN